MDTATAAGAAKNLAIKQIGSASALARRLGITKSAVCQWERVPAERVGRVSELTGIPPYVLRPDLFSPPRAEVA